MNVDKINQLEKLLQLRSNEKIVDYQLKRLTAAGENYGSLMLSLDVTIEENSNDKNTSKSLALIAKLIPPNDFIQKLFDTQQTFKNEIAFYQTVVPLLRNFQLEQGCIKMLDIFPEFYGGRINLNPSSGEVDSDAALLLENLKPAGYVNVKRTIGFDFESSKLVLKNLAQFHGVTLGLKYLHPEQFELIRPYMFVHKIDKKIIERFRENLIELINEHVPEIHIYLNRMLKAFEVARESKSKPTKELFSTMVHSDFWVNNIMVKFGQDDKIASSKFVDFQLCGYASAINDMIFFIFSSVQSEVFKQHYDELIKCYYNSLISTLKDVKCDTTPFTYEAYLDDISYQAKYSQFTHIMGMLPPIFAERWVDKEISELTQEDFGNMSCSEAHKKKLIFVVNEYVKRNWI